MSTKKNLSRIAKLVGDRVEELKGVKSQKDIADAVGYNNQNMITMIKQGTSKVGLDKAADMAKVLEVDPKEFLILAWEQFYSEELVAQMLKVLGVKGVARKN